MIVVDHISYRLTITHNSPVVPVERQTIPATRTEEEARYSGPVHAPTPRPQGCQWCELIGPANKFEQFNFLRRTASTESLYWPAGSFLPWMAQAFIGHQFIPGQLVHVVVDRNYSLPNEES